MKFPDFVVSKAVPLPDGSRLKHYIAVLEVKIPELHERGASDFPKPSPTLLSKLTQLVKYCKKMEKKPQAQIPLGEAFPSYLLYGPVYTKLKLSRTAGGDGCLKPNRGSMYSRILSPIRLP